MIADLMRPRWNSRPRANAAFSETWHVSLQDIGSSLGRPGDQTKTGALWLRFNVLISENNFRKIAEIWAVTFNPVHGLRQTQDLSMFVPLGGDPSSRSGFRIGESELTLEGTRGKIQFKGRTIRWDFRFEQSEGRGYELGQLSNQHFTVQTDLRASGWVEIDGVRREWREASAMIGHHFQNRRTHSQAWGHSNQWVTRQGERIPFVFEGVSGSARLFGPLHLPRISSFLFRYEDRDHLFDSLRDPLRVRSQFSLNEWRFRAERGQLAFEGELRAEHKDFVCLATEVTDGSILYCSGSRIASLKLLVYRRGKLEQTLLSPGTTSFEIASRRKNPYLQVLG